MPFEITQLSANEYVPEDFVKGDIPEKYFYDDAGEILIAANILDSEKVVYQLLQFIFRDKATAIEIYRDEHTVVLDLSPCKDQLISFEELDLSYQSWILETGRENTMDEYGMLLDYIGQAKRTMNKKYLLMVISTR